MTFFWELDKQNNKYLKISYDLFLNKLIHFQNLITIKNENYKHDLKYFPNYFKNVNFSQKELLNEINNWKKYLQISELINLIGYLYFIKTLFEKTNYKINKKINMAQITMQINLIINLFENYILKKEINQKSCNEIINQFLKLKIYYKYFKKLEKILNLYFVNLNNYFASYEKLNFMNNFDEKININYYQINYLFYIFEHKLDKIE